MGGQQCDFFPGVTFVEVTLFLNILRTVALAIATLLRIFLLVVVTSQNQLCSLLDCIDQIRSSKTSTSTQQVL